LAEVERSLERLMCGQLHALLVHRIADLTKPGWEHLRDALLEAKQRGWTRRIGASIYDEGQLELVCRCLEPELIQLPLNALDRRMISSGVLKRLKASGIEVHARSVFLQGLLLMDPETLPPFFAPIRDVIAALHARWTAEEATPLAGCLACVLDQDGVDAVIVGVNRQAEFDEILSAVVRAAEIGSSCCPQTTPVPSMYLDPSRWPSVLQ
jgi:aryl-alcohol dehydrogenase-like predicted oxidoreductase